MAIDQNLVIKIGDGEIHFEEPALNDWVTLVKMDNEPLDKQADKILEKVLLVSNLKRKNGEEVTVESLKRKEFSAVFFFKLKTLYFKEIMEIAQGIAGKNG